MAGSLQGKVAVIIGGATGIGLARPRNLWPKVRMCHSMVFFEGVQKCKLE